LGLTLKQSCRSWLAALLVVGCGCSAGSSAHDRSSTTPGSVSGSSSDAGPLQGAILADGVVTDAELHTAMQATVECIRRLGFDAAVLPSNLITYSAKENLTDELDAAAFTCETQYSTQVQLRYSVGHVPPEFDLEAIWDCLEERGIVDRDANSDPVEAFQMADAADSTATSACIQEGRSG